MNTEETIRTFIEFFRERGHRRVTGTSLITEPGDPVLFTTSGMHPLTPYLEGRPHPQGRSLVGLQRCLRTTDLDEVGDNTHLTLFEMLGSWSLGSYTGPQSLRWGLELLRDGFGMDLRRLHVTVFEGDEEVVETWHSLEVPIEITTDENWWSNGPTGPCGPDSEIFVWTGDTPPEGRPTTDPRWVEVWNHVFMRYRRGDDGRLSPLVQSNVDTGMGLERMLTVLQGKRSVFECDLFEPWMRTVPRLWPLDEPSLRLVVDHLRSGIVVIGDGVRPSNTGRGYVLRRLTRRVLTTLWRDDPTRSLGDLPRDPVEHTIEHFGLVPTDVLGILHDEERRFRDLLRRGRSIVSRQRLRGPLTEDDFRYLHDTHGLPRDLVVTILDS
jgi:alanyl-tRNA synthetase